MINGLLKFTIFSTNQSDGYCYYKNLQIIVHVRLCVFVFSSATILMSYLVSVSISYYRVPQLKLYNSRSLFFHLIDNFLMSRIHFHILQTWKFYDISSFFDLRKVIFHKSDFFQKKIFSKIFFIFSKKFFFRNFQFAMVINDF